MTTQSDTTLLSGSPLQEFANNWPAVFAAVELDRMTGNAYRWRSLQNELSRGQAPRDMVIKQGTRKSLLLRDKFLAFWQGKLSPATANLKFRRVHAGGRGMK